MGARDGEIARLGAQLARWGPDPDRLGSQRRIQAAEALVLSLNRQVDDLQSQLRGAPAGCCCGGSLCRARRRGPGGLLDCGAALADAGLGVGAHRIVLAADGADVQAALAGMQEEAGAQVGTVRELARGCQASSVCEDALCADARSHVMALQAQVRKLKAGLEAAEAARKRAEELAAQAQARAADIRTRFDKREVGRTACMERAASMQDRSCRKHSCRQTAPLQHQHQHQHPDC